MKDDLRSEIRAAFEKEQAGEAPTPALRREVLDDVAARSRPARSYQWVAVAATVLLAIVVISGLMATRLMRHASVPAASPNPSPVADYGPPLVGVPLLYVVDPNHPSWLIGFDWSGKPRGTVKLAQPQTAVTMAPDGQSFAVGLTAKGGNWQYLDRLGHAITPTTSLPGAYSTMWADDDQHICTMTFDQGTSAYTLWTDQPGQPARSLGVIAQDQGVGQTIVDVMACSFTSDTAIVVRTSIAWASELWVVKLSDGSVVAHHTYPANAVSGVTASRDAVYLAENSAKGTGPDASAAAPSTIIRRVADWQSQSALDPSTQVLGFNNDDSLVLAATSPMTAGPTHLAIIGWGARTSYWTYEGPEALQGFVAQPGAAAVFTPGFAIALSDPSNPSDQLRDVLIMNGCCTVNPLPGRYAVTW